MGWNQLSKVKYEKPMIRKSVQSTTWWVRDLFVPDGMQVDKTVRVKI